MICSAETLTLRDGRQCTLRSVEPEDAQLMLQYMKVMLGETPFLLRPPEEFNYTVEEEASVLAGRRDDPRSLMLVAEKDGRIIASADICSHGPKSRLLHRSDLGISILKDYWHLGLGSALMERLIDLYMKYGFTVFGTRPHGMKYPDGSYDNDYLMVRML